MKFKTFVPYDGKEVMDEICFKKSPLPGQQLDDDTDSDSSELSSSFEIDRRNDDSTPMKFLNSKESFNFASEWPKAIQLIKYFHPSVRDNIPISKPDDAEHAFNFSYKTAEFISRTLSRLDLTSNYCLKPLLNVSRIQFDNKYLPEISDFLSNKRLKVGIQNHLPSYCINRSTNTLHSTNTLLDVADREQAATACLHMDLVYVMASLLPELANSEKDFHLLNAFSNLTIKNAESIAAYSLAQTSLRRSKLRNSMFTQPPNNIQMKFLKSSVISSTLFSEQIKNKIRNYHDDRQDHNPRKRSKK